MADDAPQGGSLIQVPRLKSQYRFVAIAHDASALVSEVSETLLYGELYPRIVPLIDGQRTADEIAEEVSHGFPLEQAYFHLLRLEELGFIEEDRPADPGGAAFWGILGGNPTTMEKGAPPTTVRLAVVGGENPEPTRRLFSDVAGLKVVPGEWSDCLLDDRPRIVLTRDYLEPELEEINRLALESGRSWYLFKPAGIQPWVGPLFRPRRTACWECLAVRLRGHRILESYAASERRRREPLRLSIARTESSVAAAAALLAADVSRVHAECGSSTLEGTILSLDFRCLDLRKHHLVKIPGCPACGTRHASPSTGGLSKEPPRLVSRRKSDHRDGGHRIRTAEETLKVLKPHISPICGLIGTVLPLRAEKRLFGHLFQATYPIGRTKECFRGEQVDIRGVSNGKGHGETQAMVSAMAEAMERFSALRTSHAPVVRAPLQDLGEEAVPPTDLLLLSDRQWVEHKDACRRDGLVDPYERSTPIDWTPCWSVSGDRWTLVPSSLVNHPLPTGSGRRYLSHASNGLASGSCVEEAVLHALFEVVEREGLGLWWYNQLSLRAVDINSFDDRDADETVVFLNEQGWDLQVLDVTTDLGIPVFAAVAVHRTEEQADPLLGAGAHFDARIALRRALGEVAQAWHGLPNAYRASEYCLRHGLPRLGGMEFLRPRSHAEKRPLAAFVDRSSDDLLADIQYLTGLLEDRGMELLVADLSRADVPLKTVRVLIPGIRSAHPYFGEGRLYDVPVSQGRLARRWTEEELNPIPFMQILNRSWGSSVHLSVSQ